MVESTRHRRPSSRGQDSGSRQNRTAPNSALRQLRDGFGLRTTLQPEAQIKALAAGVEVDDDPEVNYFFAAHLAYCGQTEAALRMLNLAIKRNYCSYPAMDKDPFFDQVRADPEFSNIRAAGVACHDNFATNREQVSIHVESGLPTTARAPAL